MKTTITLIIALLFSNPFTNEVEIEDKSNIEVTLAADLFESIRSIDIVSLNIHLAEGANVDTVDNEGNTPLMLAAKIGNPIGPVVTGGSIAVNLEPEEVGDRKIFCREHIKDIGI